VLDVAGLSTWNSLPKRPRDSFRSLSVLAVFLKHSSFQSSNMERKCADTILAECRFHGLAISNAKIL